MSTDLSTQLRSYFERIDEGQEPIRPDEVAELLASPSVLPFEPVPPREPTPRRWLAAVAAGIMILVLGAWLLSTADRNVTIVDQPTTPTSAAIPDDAADEENGLSEDAVGGGSVLTWQRGSVPENAAGLKALLSDGTTFYWVGARTFRSVDGQVWDEIGVDLREVDAFGAGRFADVSVSASVDGSTLFVVIEGIDGTRVESTLAPEIPPNPAGSVEIFEAAVAVGSQGAIVTADVDEVSLGDQHVSSRRVAWFLPDGEEWEPIELPRPGSREALTAIASGFTVIDDAGALWFSHDGSDWSEVEAPDGPIDAIGVVPWADQAIVIAHSGTYVFADERLAPLPVTDIDGPGLSSGPPFHTVGTGGAGLAYLVEAASEPSMFELVYSPNGVKFERQPLPEDVAAWPENYPLGIWGPLGVVVGSEQVLYLADHVDGAQIWIGTPEPTNDP